MNRLKRVWPRRQLRFPVHDIVCRRAGGRCPDESARFDEFWPRCLPPLTSSHDLSIHLQFNDPPGL